MLTVAELVARLRADNSHFSRGMAQAERDLGRVEKAGTSVTRSLSRLGGQLDQMGNGLALAATGMAASLIAVGTQYNTLLQKTNAAFQTLLGSADKAQSMIADLTAFARESPFPRQVFIAATQQLLGFGLAAEKVIPAFQAIQDAVAATGGGAAEIQQFTDIFAQIKSFGRANTETLMRFSYAGIDAFKLLAGQAGVSVAEIRKQVTDGMLDADKAIEMLTAGLTGKFEGAAAGVKDTWIGTKDRIAGAWRDIGSALVAPFIDPNGGGLLVIIGNKLADLMRLIANDYAPKAGLAIKRFVDEWRPLIEDFDAGEFMDQASKAVDKFRDSADALLPVLAAVSVGFASSGLNMIPFVGQLIPAVGLTGKLVLALTGLVMSNDEARGAVMGLGDTLRDGLGSVMPMIVAGLNEMLITVAELVPPLVEMTRTLLEAGWPLFVAGIKAAASALTILLAIAQPIADFFADHPSAVKAVVAAYATWRIAQLGTALAVLAVRLRAVAAANLMVGASASGRAAAGAAGMAGQAAGLAARFGPAAAGAAGSMGAQMGAAAVNSSMLLQSVGKLSILLRTGLAVAPVAALAYGFMELNKAVTDVDKSLAAMLGEIDAIDTTSVKGLEEALARVNTELGETDKYKAKPNLAAQIAASVGRPFGLTGIHNRIFGDGDKSKEAEEALLERQRKIRLQLAYTAAMVPRIARAWDIFSGAINRSIDPLSNFTSETGRALVGIGQLTDGIMEATAATDGAMQDFMSPMNAWSAAQSAAKGPDVADLTRDLAGAQRDYEDAGRGVTDAQRRVNEVLAEQFDVASAASEAISDLTNAQRSQMDPVFAYLKAMEALNKINIGSGVTRAVDDDTGLPTPLSFDNKAGDTVLDQAEAALALDSAAIGLVGAISTGQTSLEAVGAHLNRWVQQGTMTAEHASDLYRQIEAGVSNAHALQGQVAGQVGTAVAASRAEFDAQVQQDLTEALRGVEDALIGADDARRRIAEISAEMNGVDLGGFNGAVEESAVGFDDFMGHMRGNVEDMRTWMDNIREIAKNGGPELAQEVLKWGPQMAPLVAEIARSTPEQFNDFVTLMAEKMALTSGALNAELQSMKWMAENVTPEIAKALEEEMGVTPQKLGDIYALVEEDFGRTMDAMAVIAEEGGRTSIATLVRKLSEQWNISKPEVFGILSEIGLKFGELNNYVNGLNWKMPTFPDGTAFAPELGSLAPNAQVSLPTGVTSRATADADALKRWNDALAVQRWNNAKAGLGAYTDEELAKFFAGMGTSGSGGLNWTGLQNVPVMSFADGGIRMPSIARGIQFAEPETHGEAYIPLALSKRAAAMGVLGQVAGLFGMAPAEDMYGGGTSAAGTSGGNTFEVEQNIYHYGPDSGAERGVRELEKMAYNNGWTD